ncbi:MAG: hypothetical protein Fur0012_08660 [Elusimicrobiota bacterium]
MTLLRSCPWEKMVFLPEESSFCQQLEKHKIPYRVIPVSLLRDNIRQYSPDIVHCNAATVRYAFIAALFCSLEKIPFIWHLRVTERAFLKDDIIALLSDRIIAISSAVKNKLRTFWRPKVSVVYNAVSADFVPAISAGEIRKKLALSPEDRVIGVFSRFVKFKGHNIFLSAAFRLLERRQDLKFLLVGEGEIKEEIKKRVILSSRPENFIFTGHIENVADYMNICDIVVNPSQDIEGFGRVIIEAMSLGKIPVSTALGGPEEIISDGEDGFLCSPEPESMAAAIEKALSAPGFMREKVIIKAKEKFSVEKNVSQIMEIYESVIKRSENRVGYI